MEDGSELGPVGKFNALEAVLCKLANTHRELWLKDINHGLEVGIASIEEGLAFGGRELVRSSVAAAFFHENKRAIVGDEAVCKEALRIRMPVFEEAPKTASRDFGLLAIEALDEAFGVLLARFANRSVNAHPVAHVFDFAKGHARLGHSPWAWIHPQKEHPFLRVCKALKIETMGLPSVIERVVDVGDGFRKGQLIDPGGQLLGRRDELV